MTTPTAPTNPTAPTSPTRRVALSARPPLLVDVLSLLLRATGAEVVIDPNGDEGRFDIAIVLEPGGRDVEAALYVTLDPPEVRRGGAELVDGDGRHLGSVAGSDELITFLLAGVDGGSNGGCGSHG